MEYIIGALCGLGIALLIMTVAALIGVAIDNATDYRPLEDEEDWNEGGIL